MTLKGPYSVEQDRLDEVLAAVAKQASVVPGYSAAKRQVVFVSKADPKPGFRRHFREFQLYVRARYAVRMIVVGGGFGCVRLTIDLDAADAADALQLLEDLKYKDSALYSRIKRLQIDHMTDTSTNEQTDLSDKTSYPPPPGSKPKTAPSLDNLAGLLRYIHSQLPKLETLLNRCNSGPQLFIQYENTLKQLLPALAEEVVKELFNEDDWRHLAHLGEQVKFLSCVSAKEAFAVSDKILGAVEKAKEMKFPSRPPEGNPS